MPSTTKIPKMAFFDLNIFEKFIDAYSNTRFTFFNDF